MTNIGSSAAQRNEDRRAARGIKKLQDVQVPLRDGSYLLADVFLPASEDANPVIIRLGVYGKAFDFGSICDEEAQLASEEREDAFFARERPISTSPPMAFYENMVSANVMDWVPRGYVCIRVDARGVGKVAGTIDPFSCTEARDYYDVIEWAAKQPWSNGIVGLYGGSYHADSQWPVASLAPPSLKAMIPFAMDVDIYHEVAYPGGLCMTGFLSSWFESNVKAAQGRPNPRTVDFLQRIADHPFKEPEQYGPEGKILVIPDHTKIQVPFLTSVCLGAPIHGSGGSEAFLSVDNAENQLLVVDSNYWPFMYQDCLEQQIAFFDRHLKGNTADAEYPRVRMLMRTGEGAFEWRTDTQWPLTDTQYMPFYLESTASGGRSSGMLLTKAPQETAVMEYSAEAPAYLDTAGPCAIFESEPLELDLEIGGLVTAELWVSTTTSDMDVYTILRVLDQDEREVSYTVRPLARGAPLSHGCLKVSHRKLDLERSTEYRPWHTHREADYAPLQADEVVPIKIGMTLTTARVARGHRLQFIVEPYSGHSSSTWRAYGGVAGASAADRHDVVGGRTYDHSYHDNARNRIHTGPKHLSKLLIPIIPRQS